MEIRPLGLTANEAAVALRCHVNSVYAWFNDGQLPGCKLGRKIIISRAGVEAMIGQRNVNGKHVPCPT